MSRYFLLAVVFLASATHELTIPNRDAVLAATLVLPDIGRPPYPAVVLVHGSGQVTAQEQLNSMAQRVATFGVAVLAYDKRGVGRSTGQYPGSEQGLTDNDIERRMSGFHGPYGYDPATALSSLTTPSLWILGENDRSIPLRRTVEVLTRLSQARPKAF